MLNRISVEGIPVCIDASGCGGTLSWIEDNCEDLRRSIDSAGVVLVRNLKPVTSSQFSQALKLVFGAELLEYTYRSTPRTKLRGNVYTATEYPPTETIPQHNENAYSRRWPHRLGFICISPADTGGETPLGDSRKVFKEIPGRVAKKFIETGVLYVRNYSQLDLPWTEVFQTDDKEQVEDFCTSNELSFEWLPNNTLRTSQVNPATVLHPRTGEVVWFNQAHLFHVSSLGEDLADTMINTLGFENLPRNALYGDGTPIPSEDVDVIRAAYESTKIAFQWQRNDLLLLDNLLYHHGREPFTGSRKVLVGMACANSLETARDLAQ